MEKNNSKLDKLSIIAKLLPSELSALKGGCEIIIIDGEEYEVIWINGNTVVRKRPGRTK